RLTSLTALVSLMILVATVLPRTSASAAAGPPAALMPHQGAYVGAYVGPRSGESRQQAILRVEAELGRTLKIDHEYYKWDTAVPTAQESWAVGRGMIPFVNWKAQRSD